MVFVEGGLRRLEEPVDEAIGIGTGKAIDHTAVIVAAEADPVVHGGIGHRSLEVLPAGK